MLKIREQEFVQIPICTAQIQLDFITPSDVQFAGAFATVGVHLVVAVLEPYAWKQRAPPIYFKLPIQVMPPQMAAAQLLGKSAALLQEAT